MRIKCNWIETEVKQASNDTHRIWRIIELPMNTPYFDRMGQKVNTLLRSVSNGVMSPNNTIDLRK